jgi:hypothetical protein
VVEQLVELAAANHRGLVHDDDIASAQADFAASDAAEQPVERARRDRSGVLESSGCSCGERAAVHAVTAPSPRLRGHGESGRLARAGNSLDDVDARSRTAQRAHHPRLLIRQHPRGDERRFGWLVSDNAGPFIPTLRRPDQQPLLGRDHLGSGEPHQRVTGRHQLAVISPQRWSVVNVERDHMRRRQEPVGQREDILDPAAVGQRLADRLDHMPHIER